MLCDHPFKETKQQKEQWGGVWRQGGGWGGGLDRIWKMKSRQYRGSS